MIIIFFRRHLLLSTEIASKNVVDMPWQENIVFTKFLGAIFHTAKQKSHFYLNLVSMALPHMHSNFFIFLNNKSIIWYCKPFRWTKKAHTCRLHIVKILAEFCFWPNNIIYANKQVYTCFVLTWQNYFCCVVACDFFRHLFAYTFRIRTNETRSFRSLRCPWFYIQPYIHRTYDIRRVLCFCFFVLTIKISNNAIELRN